LSVRYSNSPALHLRIGESQLRGTLHRAFCLVCYYALWLIFVRGYTILVVLLTLLVTSLLWHLRRDRFVAVELRWQQGLWTLERAGEQRHIVLTKRSTATPWVIYLGFSDVSAGCCGHLWLFADCSSSEQLRRLRVRLTLDR
jgi:hypothetical protein